MPVSNEICSMDLPSVIWPAVRASAGVKSNSACSNDGAGLALGVIDVVKTIDSAPAKTSRPSAPQRHDMRDEGGFCPDSPNRNGFSDPAGRNPCVRDRFHQKSLRRGGRKLDHVARADPDARLTGKKSRIRRNHAAIRCQRRSRKADRFQRRNRGFRPVQPEASRKQRCPGKMRPQAIELLCDRAGHRAFRVGLLDRKHQGVAGGRADRRPDAPAKTTGPQQFGVKVRGIDLLGRHRIEVRQKPRFLARNKTLPAWIIEIPLAADPFFHGALDRLGRKPSGHTRACGKKQRTFGIRHYRQTIEYCLPFLRNYCRFIDIVYEWICLHALPRTSLRLIPMIGLR